jgi:membrane-bound lytic murein transglycosylase D
MIKSTYFAAAFLLITFFSSFSALANNGNDLPETLGRFGDKTADSLVIKMTALLNNFPEYTDEEYRQRLKELSTEIDYRLDPLVKERILVRTENYRSSTEFILGKSDMYFPIFEEHLAKYNVPHHLKYLAIVESHLNPVAKSVASAVGLWQFIPSSGQLFGLDINSYVDERSDTYKASDAAARLLSVLFEKYNDWALAMAAYNCGPGRVDNAIKAAKSNDYWVVRNYLPKETQKYVPFFMAMVYVGEFHASHDLVPTKLPSDLVLTDTVHIGGGISMFDLAKQLDISVDTLKLLNPAYRRNYIPQDKGGQIIVLPARIVAQIKGYQSAFDRAQSIQKSNPIKAVRRISSERELQWLCRAHRCSVEDILYWNELPAEYSPKEGDLIAIRKHNIAQNPIAARRRITQIETIAMPSFKVTGIDTVNNRLCTTSVLMKPGKFNDGIACTPHMEQSVKASSRYRIQSASCGAKSTDPIAVPKAGTFEASGKNQAANYVPVVESKGVGLLPQEGNGTVADDIDDASFSFPIESSYSDNTVLPEAEETKVQNGNSLIPADMQKKLPQIAEQKNGNEVNTELPERSRARNIRAAGDTAPNHPK